MLREGGGEEGREGGREGERDGGREEEGGREKEMEGGRKGKGGREGREGGREVQRTHNMQTCLCEFTTDLIVLKMLEWLGTDMTNLLKLHNLCDLHELRSLASVVSKDLPDLILFLHSFEQLLTSSSTSPPTASSQRVAEYSVAVSDGCSSGRSSITTVTTMASWKWKEGERWRRERVGGKEMKEREGG